MKKFHLLFLCMFLLIVGLCLFPFGVRATIQEEIPGKETVESPAAPILVDYCATRVVLQKVDAYEYRLGDGPWTTDNIFTGLSANTTYTFYQRIAETETSYASAASAPLSVKTPGKTACTIKPAAPIVAIYTQTEVTLEPREGYEYRVGDGPWTSNNVFTVLEPKTTYTFYQRIAESEGEFASEASEGVMQKTRKDTYTNVTERFWKLHGYIIENGNYDAEQGVYYIDISALDAGDSVIVTQIWAAESAIGFSNMVSYKEDTGVVAVTDISMASDTDVVTINHLVAVVEENAIQCGGYGYSTIKRGDYRAASTYNYAAHNAYDEAQEGYPKMEDAAYNEVCNANVHMLFEITDAYLYEKLGHGMRAMGFALYIGAGYKSCDPIAGTHAGSNEHLSFHGRTCMTNGYSGDIYCDSCGEHRTQGRVIPAIGYHTYSDDCDKTCNVCGEERRVYHSYSGPCDRCCDLCEHKRTALTVHTYDTEEPCHLCGAPHLPGDVDGDEEVADGDAVYLLYHTFLSDLYPVAQSCDFNGDGEVNDGDAVYLLYYTFLPDLYPLH